MAESSQNKAVAIKRNLNLDLVKLLVCKAANQNSVSYAKRYFAFGFFIRADKKLITKRHTLAVLVSWLFDNLILPFAMFTTHCSE